MSVLSIYYLIATYNHVQIFFIGIHDILLGTCYLLALIGYFFLAIYFTSYPGCVWVWVSIRDVTGSLIIMMVVAWRRGSLRVAAGGRTVSCYFGTRLFRMSSHSSFQRGSQNPVCTPPPHPPQCLSLAASAADRLPTACSRPGRVPPLFKFFNQLG